MLAAGARASRAKALPAQWVVAAMGALVERLVLATGARARQRAERALVARLESLGHPVPKQAAWVQVVELCLEAAMAAWATRLALVAARLWQVLQVQVERRQRAAAPAGSGGVRALAGPKW